MAKCLGQKSFCSDKESMVDGHHPHWRNGVELLEDAALNDVLRTGCQGIDILLHGGLREGELTELVGPSSSGKTQICFSAASYVADEYGGLVIFLDTGNSFSSQRIASFANGLSDPFADEATEGRIRRILSRISFHSVYDIFALLKMLEQLNVTLKQQKQEMKSKLRLLIVDSISSLVAPIIGGKHSQGRSLMVSVGFLLKKMAIENNLAVLVTNHTVSEGNGLKPALGESWKSIPSVRLKLSCNKENSSYEATVMKHSMIMLGTSATFSFHE